MTSRWVRYCGQVAAVERLLDRGVITRQEFAARKVELRLEYRAGQL